MTFGEYLNGQFALAQNLEFFLRVLIAGLFGAAIGFERTRRFKEAGIRTHVIVCAAAALMMIVSKYGFADLSGPDGVFNGTRGADPARIAAQVVSGISFLCAGVIFKNGNTVKGLTTAAGIWATAGIGLAVGAGLYWLGLFATVLIALLQIVMHRFTVGADSYSTCQLSLRVREDEGFRALMREELKTRSAQIVNLQMTRSEDGSVSYDLTLRTPRELTPEDLIAFSHEHPEILEIGSSQIG
ncbi:MAG: MgtC/SapB family protein [Oscillospiraceae bacterium]|nr:MgtC/SapB family protein [Oscillospiraceae bacterium]